MVTIWWDDDRIESTVTRDFVCRHLLPQEIERLNGQVGFGDGLTNDTYWDWIETKVKRIFLILVDLGVPDQIFGLIDDSWNDSDLPLDFVNISRLALTATKDEKIERRFYQRQFHYMLRPLVKGASIVYEDDEIVPIDAADKKATTTSNGMVDKVTIGNNADDIFWRRRIPLDVHGGLPMVEFQDAVENMRQFENEHLVSYWGSYVYQDFGYIIYTPASDFSLKSFLTTQPACYKNLPKLKRKEMVMNWIMCLADTVCFLHSRHCAHSYIKPSTIHFTKSNKVFFSDTSKLGPEPMNNPTERASSFEREWYDYAAPEQWFRPGTTGNTPNSSRKPSLLSSSPDNHLAISIPRGGEFASPSAILHTPNPQLSPQAADIFSLGCIILELLTFLLKKQQKFASHRAAKHKTAGRGGAVLDSSFHKNLGQVESWMTDLAKEANKKASNKDGNHVFRGFVPILHIVARMLSVNPQDRPTAHEVQQRIYEIITEHCQIPEPHCVHRYNFDLNSAFGHMRIQPSLDSISLRAQQMSGSAYMPRGPGSHHQRTGSGGGMSSYTASTASGSFVEQQERDLSVNIETLRSLRSREHMHMHMPMATPMQMQIQMQMQMQSMPSSPRMWDGMSHSPVNNSFRNGVY
ncbi:hypothetical protein TD95_004627 [Thielaviopsis punctulata]|uniref:Protein kinase domain-containing protein n=1 Tax=Thielaviopsis punctulata TaxID=72032 RepID=A0A0F4ZEP4_9PEZI|nr:hypothetical protein TD95_004627 [Thielaviopsis punctulata]